jgi:hypothetical protein
MNLPARGPPPGTSSRGVAGLTASCQPPPLLASPTRSRFARFQHLVCLTIGCSTPPVGQTNFLSFEDARGGFASAPRDLADPSRYLVEPAAWGS